MKTVLVGSMNVTNESVKTFVGSDIPFCNITSKVIHCPQQIWSCFTSQVETLEHSLGSMWCQVSLGLEILD